LPQAQSLLSPLEAIQPPPDRMLPIALSIALSALV
jgi:hypothetical protein